MVYKIIPINYNSKLEELQKNSIKHKFLYQSVKDEIILYEESESSNIKIYCIFGFYFLIAKAANCTSVDEIRISDFKKLDDSQAYYGHYFHNLQADENISQSLRNSNTLKISDINCYDNSDIKVVFAESGFVVCSKLNLSAEDKFDRVLLLFLLSLAYNLKAEKLLQDVSNSYKKSSYEDMILLRDEIYAFDLNCYFYNPVKQNKHQVYNIWNLISQNYDVKIKHDEIKSQVVDLTGIIELKHKSILEENAQKSTTKLNIIMIILAAASFISIFKDELKALIGN
ncbi:hypothetical protein NG749_04345 [Aliarcobacter cryaerophilus]|uniref:Uncharacterized protein n=1 Tax=Arcobacter porcinus TaxID=1935204 RepID=A0ABX2YFD0_9BACT|nr:MULTISPECIES: hypothetical protein [Arcobacteraceae]AZL53762.1 hypothetical protein EI285_03880 [Aliarcobacter skirrowii]OCL90831.1 hypothetical protein AAX28_01650 [Arcobacter porcinus]